MAKNQSAARRSAGRTSEITSFRCIHCGRPVGPTMSGGRQRNHCPYCLWSLHIDQDPGDRGAACKTPMEPVAIWVKRNGEWSLVHRCEGCGALHSNRIASDDNPIALVSLALRPIVLPAFPLPIPLPDQSSEIGFDV